MVYCSICICIFIEQLQQKTSVHNHKTVSYVKRYYCRLKQMPDALLGRSVSHHSVTKCMPRDNKEWQGEMKR